MAASSSRLLRTQLARVSATTQPGREPPGVAGPRATGDRVVATHERLVRLVGADPGAVGPALQELQAAAPVEAVVLAARRHHLDDRRGAAVDLRQQRRVLQVEAGARTAVAEVPDTESEPGTDLHGERPVREAAEGLGRTQERHEPALGQRSRVRPAEEQLRSREPVLGVVHHLSVAP